ncbi:MAG: CBS domain-containing protein [Cellulophaga sp.]
MNIHSHIVTNIPVFKVKKSLKEVIQFFKNSTFSHVAIVDKKRFRGVLSENDLETFEADKKIEDYQFNLESVYVEKESSWFDVMEVFARNDANIIPVLNKKEEVVGYYNLGDVVGMIMDTPFFTEEGGVLVIAKGIKEYSFSEIAQIVESNNAKLLGGVVTGVKNDVIQVTLKIGVTNLNDIIQSFRRYNYNILFGNNDDQFMEDLKQRSDYLNKYLNV